MKTPAPPIAQPRLVAQLRSRQILRGAMDYHRLTVRELSVACGNPKHRSIIGHLHSGARDRCPPFLARRIEEALCMPPGSVFELRVCRISSEAEHIADPARGRKTA